MFKQVGILTLSMLAAVGAYAAQPRADDFVKLKDEVARLGAQQQQILDSLDELKRMIKGPGQAALKPPETMSVAGEPFKGESRATLAIIEYADFECPYSKRAHAAVKDLTSWYGNLISIVFRASIRRRCLPLFQ